jgi:hypothetical protein
VMATSLLRCTECDAVRDPSSAPPGWYHHPRREERQRIWPDRCPLCAHVSRPSAPAVTAVEAPKSPSEPPDDGTKVESVPNPRMDLANLEAMWAYASTQRERAQIEAQMWEIAKPALTRATRKRGISNWLCGRLKEPHDVVEDRHMLHRQGLTVNELWNRVDGSERMLVRRAAQILSKAKLRAMSESVSLRDAINSELDDYGRGTLIITPAGTFRRRESRVRGTLKGAATMPHVSGKPKRAVDLTAARDLWLALRASAKRIVDHELRGLGNAYVKEQLQSQMEAELDGTIRSLQARVQKARNTAHLDGAPAVVANPAEERRLLKRACQILSVDPPHGGIDVDFALYKRAKTNYRRLVLEYHPDHGGDTERYDAVVKAMNVIEERYQATTNSSATANKSNTNDKDP